MILEWIYPNIILLFILHRRLREESNQAELVAELRQDDGFPSLRACVHCVSISVARLTIRTPRSWDLHAVAARIRHSMLPSPCHSNKENDLTFKTSLVLLLQTNRPESTPKLGFRLWNWCAYSSILSSLLLSLPPSPHQLIPLCIPTAMICIYVVLNLTLAQNL